VGGADKSNALLRPVFVRGDGRLSPIAGLPSRVRVLHSTGTPPPVFAAIVPNVDVQPSRDAFLEARDPSQLRPVWSQVLCDAETPVGTYARLRAHFEAPMLLESMVGGERWARYSFISLSHRFHIRGVLDPDHRLRFTLRPGPGFSLPPEIPAEIVGLDGLRNLLREFRCLPAEGLPRFWGGLLGVFGHDFVRSVERLPLPAHQGTHRAADLPVVELVATDTVVIFDNLTQHVHVVATACPRLDGGPEQAWERAAARVEEVCRMLRRPEGHAPALRLARDVAWTPEAAPPWSPDQYISAVQAAKEHIAAGDIFQVVLAQGFEVPQRELDPLDVYRVLRVSNPSPYMYMMELPAATLVGASPEVLVRVDRDTRAVTVRPIAGTRRRGKDDAEDQALERDLLADPKERAEHLMLIDLGRNDIGRVSVGGSVRTTDQFVVERYSRVMHIVSEVTGTLGPEVDALDVLEAVFPAGTLSGAPKVRALEIIDTLEAGRRGWYGGAVGYLGYDGGADFAICIRSTVVAGGQFLVQAGAGIVYDSDPKAEDRECAHKAHAVLQAIATAQNARTR